jgi:hypothetical protein
MRKKARELRAVRKKTREMRRETPRHVEKKEAEDLDIELKSDGTERF